MAAIEPQQVFADEVVNADDEDSGSSIYEGSLSSDLTSLTSTVYNYQYENGRRYHNFRAGKYVLPNDETEQDRLDAGHHLWMLTMKGRLFSAPLPPDGPKRCLDLGTGTGIWAIDFGDMCPKCEVIGTDLSPIQPKWVPPNVRFEVDDFEDDWVYEKGSFDYIHVRNLVGAVADWKGFIKKMYDTTEPGGYVELQETDVGRFYSDDNTVKPDSPWREYYKHFLAASTQIGRRMDISPELGDLLSEAGFEDVRLEKYKVPFTPWAKDKRYKELGQWAKHLTSTGAEAYALALFTRVLGMSDKEARQIINNVVKEMDDLSVHIYFIVYVFSARKPESEKA